MSAVPVYDTELAKWREDRVVPPLVVASAEARLAMAWLLLELDIGVVKKDVQGPENEWIQRHPVIPCYHMLSK